MMKLRRATRLERLLGFLGTLVVGCVFGWVCWMEEKVAVGAIIFVLAAAIGLYLLCASDEALSKTPWWMFW